MKSQGKIILGVFLCILSWVALTSCGPSSGSLVGKWQSSKPEFVTLTIALGASHEDGFHAGFSYTMRGQTANWLWQVANMDGVTYLYLASEGGLRMYGFSGSLMATAHRFKVIEVTSDKLVVTLYPLGSGEADTIYEFHRIK